MMTKARLTVVESVYHQINGEQPTIVDPGYTVPIKSDEQPYIRRLTITDSWQPLDCGWINKASLLVLQNTERDPSKRIELSNGVYIPVGASVRLYVNDIHELKIRCVEGNGRAVINLYPE